MSGGRKSVWTFLISRKWSFFVVSCFMVLECVPVSRAGIVDLTRA